MRIKSITADKKCKTLQSTSVSPPALLPLPSSPFPSLLSITAEQNEAAIEPSVADLDELFPFLKGNSPLLQLALLAGGELSSKCHFPKPAGHTEPMWRLWRRMSVNKY